MAVTVQWAATLQTLLMVALAFVLGTLIGLERQYRQRSAGLRTTVLVAIGACAFTELGTRINGAAGASQLTAYIISGIGFLGAGVILKEGANVRGLNTAATVWCSAAVGSFCGAGFPVEATMLAAFVLSANTLLRPLVNWVNRLPLQTESSEAEYQVHVMCLMADVTDVRDLIEAQAGDAGYPVGDIESVTRSGDVVELEATLVPTSAEPAELDRMVAAIERSSKVRSATWSVGTIQG